MKNTTSIYQEINNKLDSLGNKGTPKDRAWVQKYLGSDKTTLCVKTGDIKKIAKDISKKYDFDKNSLVNLLDLIYSKATTFEEMAVAASLLGALPKIKSRLDPESLDNWLLFTVGWAETDVLCQSNFTADDLLNNWHRWQKFLRYLAKSDNIHKRRASMVLLCKSLRQSDDPRLMNFAFEQIEKLKHEKEILITKAVSWLLRSLVKFHPRELSEYLNNHQTTLPKIAYREANSKLLTGKKYVNKSKKFN
ncbi:MAG: DNA alkylation repair protein [Candidatus Shapirobacteria bacterium]|jgi:3-methyladenine DNA glycosylase AlkD